MMGCDINTLSYMRDLACIERLPEIDVMIIAASNDVRGYATYYRLLKKETKIRKIIIFDYQKYRPDLNDKEALEFYYQLNTDQKVQYVNCNSNEDGLYLCQSDIGPDSVVLVDITSISTPDIFRLFFVLKKMLGIKELFTTYAEPKYYENINGLLYNCDDRIGQFELKMLEEYYSSSMHREDILVCFLGFSHFISKAIYEKKDGSDIVIVNGFPSYYPKIKDISLEHNYELISTVGHDKIRYAEANNPFSAYNVLADIGRNNQDYILDICVLGSKPMALGSCLYALKNSESTKVSYPFYKKARKHSIIDISKIWLYRIVL